MEGRVRRAIDDVQATAARGESVWPVLEYADIANGTVTAEQLAYLRRRGCLVVRGHFSHEQGLAWDRDIVDYLDSNEFFENYRGPADRQFDSVESKPEIYPVYWSPAQMQARQSDRMDTVQRFLNRMWRSESGGVRWFDPDRNALYPDRIRRRPEGANSGGLGTHIDPGTLDLWLKQANQQAFAHLFDGTVEQYDPWDAAHRTVTPSYPGITCSVFRSFQGWTALSDMDHDQGVLHAIPVPEAMGYLMLRPLLFDVADDDLCGVTVDQVFPVSVKYHDVLLDALSGIPDVRAGDSVWWHCDLIHSVAPVSRQQGWGNVMYIPAAPWCERNAQFMAGVREAFRAGDSPPDFPEEHYERGWPNRFGVADLNENGRRSLGLTS
jgi:hypothetical protein